MTLVILILFIAVANFAIGFALAMYAGQGPATDRLGRWPKWREAKARAVGEAPLQTDGQPN